MLFTRVLALSFAFVGVCAFTLTAADKTPAAASLTEGDVSLKSAGALAFAPGGVLLVGDAQAAAIYAIATGESAAKESFGKGPSVEGIDAKIADLLGTEAKNVAVKDLAVNPETGTTYLSVEGPAKAAVLVRVGRDGKLSEFSLKKVKSAKATLPNAAKGQEAITQLAYVKGRVFVAGLATEEFSSKLRSIPYPFDGTAGADAKGTSIEIYHGAHGKFETKSPIRVFTSYKIGDEENILAAYTCTPLVRMPVKALEPEKKIKAVTVAELGNRNRPLSMIVYNKGGKDYVLMANSSRGLMKIPLEGVEKIEGITARVKDKAGLTYTTIEGREGVQKLDAYGKENALLLVRGKDGKLNLEPIALP